MPEQNSTSTPTPPSMAEKVINWLGGILQKHTATGMAGDAYKLIESRRKELDSLLNEAAPIDKPNEFYMRDVHME